MVYFYTKNNICALLMLIIRIDAVGMATAT